MKLTNAEVIKSGEKDLIDAIIGELDWSAIERIFKQKHRLQIKDDVEYRSGDIVVHDDQIAYKLEFEVKVSLAVLVDRLGEHLEFQTDEADDGSDEAVDVAPADDMAAGEEKMPVTAEVAPTGDDAPLDTQAVAEPEENTAGLPVVDPEKEPEENVADLASDIGSMMVDLNEASG